MRSWNKHFIKQMEVPLDLYHQSESPLGSLPNHSRKEDFINFVDKVFRDCNSSHIQKLRLHYRVNDSHEQTWIKEAIRRNVSELDINVSEWPLSLFSCSTLTVLKIDAVYVGEYIPSFYLPCLKVLQIEWGNRREGFMEKLLGGCPVLEDLSLVGYLPGPGGEAFMVAPPTLRTLRIQPKQDFSWAYCDRIIFIKAPNLEYLHLKEGFFTYNIMGEFPSLIKSNVIIGAWFKGHRRRSPVFQLLKGMSAVKSLSFSFTERIRSNFTLPKFHNLTCLEVSTCDHLFWVMLPKLIKSSPSLEVLSLEQRAHDNPVLADENKWVKPKSVPKCLRHHLATMKIQGFKGRIHELELLKYCLGNAKVLQRLTINCRGLTQVEEMQFCGQLLKFSRASGNCQIHFDGNFVSNL